MCETCISLSLFFVWIRYPVAEHHPGFLTSLIEILWFCVSILLVVINFINHLASIYMIYKVNIQKMKQMMGNNFLIQFICFQKEEEKHIEFNAILRAVSSISCFSLMCIVFCLILSTVPALELVVIYFSLLCVGEFNKEKTHFNVTNR